MMGLLRKDERLDDLLGRSLQIVQSSSVFSFSLDAVLLANFVRVPIQSGRMVDLCSGNGAIPLFLSARSRAKIIGVEIQERLVDMARRSVLHNCLEDQIEMVHEDLKVVGPLLGYSQFDVVTCNPPYFQTLGKAEKNENEHFTIARHEVLCNLEDVVRVSGQLLKQGGRAAFVHRPGRLVELLHLMKQYRLEPKRLQFVYPKQGKEANMILVEGIHDAKPDLKVLPPFFVYGVDDQYTVEMSRIVDEG